MVPPSAQIANSTSPEAATDSFTFNDQFSTETSEKRSLYIKLCKIRLYSFSPSPYCRLFIIIIITIIVSNITLEKHSSPETDSKRIDSQKDLQFKPLGKNRHQLLAQSCNTMSQLYMSSCFRVIHLNRLSNVLIYSSLLFSALKSIQYSESSVPRDTESPSYRHNLDVGYFSLADSNILFFFPFPPLSVHFRFEDSPFLQYRQTLIKCNV